MHHGDILCECGQQFYFETVNSGINCIACGAQFDVSSFPPKELVVLEEAEEEDGDTI